MVCAVALSHPQPCNENVAIATISPVPGIALNFAVVKEMLKKKLVDQERVTILDIQQTQLGQAFVRFASNHARNTFVLESPHSFGDVNIPFTHHIQGRNWTRVNFNREVWLMLLGFHMDYWKDEYVEQVIGPFGKIISWAADDKHLARILVRARVVDLESIP